MNLHSNINKFVLLETILYSTFFPKGSIEHTKEAICNTTSHVIDIFYSKTTPTTGHLIKLLYSSCGTPVLINTVDENLREATAQTKFSTKVLIINSLDQVDLFMEVVYEYRFRKDRRKYFVIIEWVRESNPDHWLYYLFAKFWRKQVLNVVVILHDHSFQMYTYQLLADNGNSNVNISKPTAMEEQNFNLNVINITDYPMNKLFFNKLTNLQGRKLVVTMHPVVTRASRNIKGNGYTGIDGQVAELVRSRMNATFNYISPKIFFNGSGNTGIIGDLIEKKAHFAFNVHAYAQYNFNNTVEQTDAFDHIKFCVIVPKNGIEPIALNIFHSLSPVTWLLIVGSIIVVTVAFVVIQCMHKSIAYDHPDESTSYSVIQFTLIALQSFFGDSVQRFTSKFAIRCIFIFWIFYSFLITNSFTATVVSALVKPNHRENINTIEELGKSNLTILYPKVVGPNIKKGFDENTWDLIADNLQEVESWEKYITILNTNKTRYAYVLADYYCLYMVNSNIDKKTGQSIFHMVPECLASHPKVYLFQRGSMYLGYINELLGRFHEMGMFRKWIRETNFFNLMKGIRVCTGFNKAINYSAAKVVITLEYLQTPFYMLGVGLFISIGAFWMERMWFKFVDREKKYNGWSAEEMEIEIN